MKKLQGFTLLELLVAMAIFATAGLAIMQASAAHLRSVSQLEEMTIASYVAHNQLQLTLLDRKQWPPKEKTQGETAMANRQWLWQQQVIKLEDNDLRLLQVKISLAQQPEDIIYQLQTYIGKPGA